MLTTVSQRTTDLDSLAMSIDALLEVEEGADQQLHTQHRERWACVRSAALTADARRELAEVSHTQPEAQDRGLPFLSLLPAPLLRCRRGLAIPESDLVSLSLTLFPHSAAGALQQGGGDS